MIMGGLAEAKEDHPTQKPLVLFETPIRNHLKSGEGVYDPFVGSGTCLIAAERCGAGRTHWRSIPYMPRWPCEDGSGSQAWRRCGSMAEGSVQPDDEDSTMARSGRLRARWPERHAQEVRRHADSTETDRRAARSTPVIEDFRPPRGGTQDVFFPRSAAAEIPTIVAGDGIHLVDDRGRRLLDVASGPFLATLGQGNERVLQAMLEQGRRLTYTYSRSTRHAANAGLTERLAALAGPGLERVHLTSGGSEAVEMALKFLRQHAVAMGQPERHRIIGPWRRAPHPATASSGT